MSRIQQWFVGAGMRVMLERCWGGRVVVWLSSRALACGMSSGRVWRRTGSKAAIVVARDIISLLVAACSSGRVERWEGKLSNVARWRLVSAGQMYCFVLSACCARARCWICQVLLVGGMVVVKWVDR